MLASDVVALVESSGISALTSMYQISRRQAEQFEIQARRLVAAGHNPVIAPGDAVGTVRAHQRPTEPPQVPESADELEQTAQARARRIQAEPNASLRDHSIGQLRARIRVLERNVREGYGAEWNHDLRLTTRTLELLEGINA